MKNLDLAKLQNIVKSLPLELRTENKTAATYCSIYRYDSEDIKLPDTKQLYLYFILDGSLRLNTPSGMMDYIAGQYFISLVDTPFCGRALTSWQGDFLSLEIFIERQEVLSVLVSLEGDLPEKIAGGKISTKEKEKCDAQIFDCLERLLSCMKDRTQMSFMAGHLKREIIFNALCGSGGKGFLQAVAGRQPGKIYDINDWIKKNYKETFSVEELARQNNMSVSNLHQKFKNAVGMGVLQCQKRLRLTEARRLMLDENKNVTEASLDVGYESVSQFIREYLKMFGQSPKEDISTLKKRLQK